MLKNISLVDKIELPSSRTFTDSGQMIVPCAFARTGPMNYLATTLGITDAEDGAVIPVYRDESEVFSDASMESFRSAPVTLGHPKDSDGKGINVTAENAKDFQVGVLEGMPTRDEDTLTGTLVIAMQDAIDKIEEGTVELSAGYTCDLKMVDEDGTNKYYQTNIRANHIAIVEKGRAGSAMRISDEADASETDTDEVADKAGKDKQEAIEKKVTEDKKSSGDNSPSNNGGGKIESPNQVDLGLDGSTGKDKVKLKDEDLGNADASAIEQDILAKVQAAKDAASAASEVSVVDEEAPAKVTEDVTVEDMASMEEEEIEYSELYTLYLKAEATARCAYDACMSSKGRMEEHKKAAGMYDADDLPVFAKAEAFEKVSAKLDVANETVTRLNDELESSIEARVAVITVAKDLTALDDFAGKTVDDIRKLVVADQLPNLDLTDRAVEYINARFDILTEDSDSGNSQMSKILAQDAAQDLIPKAYVDPVKVARQNMIDRSSKRS